MTKEIHDINTKAVDFVVELIDYIFEYPDDDYMTMECLCRKLAKHGLIDKVDGRYQTHEICTNTHECVKDTHDKTEPTISKMEQVDKDINVRSNDEPQTPMCETCRYDEPNNPKCDECIAGEDKPSNYEPQTDCPWK